MTGLLYIVRRGENEELRYSLRSVAANLPHDEVWIAGNPPDWIHNVGVIATPDADTKWANVLAALEAACANDQVPNDLVYLNDDMYVVEPMTAMPMFHRGPLSEQRGYGRRLTGWSGGVAEVERLMMDIGLPGPFLSYELHVPMPIRRELMAESIETARRRAKGIRCLHYRTLYGNTWEVGGELLDDVKVYGSVRTVPDGPLLSTNDSSFSRYGAGQMLRERFPQPGPYERSNR